MEILLNYCLVQFRRLSGARGQGALEYIAIVVALILLVFLGFQAAGGDIFDKANCFISDTFGDPKAGC